MTSIADPIFTSTALTYGADANYDVEGDAYDSSALKVEPSAGQLAQGLFRPGKQIPGQQVNWVLGQFALLLSALVSNDGIHETDISAIQALNAIQDGRLDVLENYDLNLSPRIRVQSWFNSGTFQPSPRCTFGLAFGHGGGGGGGKGANGITVDDRWIAGAGGGGGAQLCMMPIALDPSQTYNIDVPAGAAGATVAGATGADGGDVVLRLGASPLVTFPGAQGGRGAVGAHALSLFVHYSFGGLPRKGTPVMLLGNAGQGIRYDSSGAGAFSSASGISAYIPMQAGQGGYGAGGSTNPGASAGSPNATTNQPGGTAGAQGADLGSARGGGGGGGGGGGPFGAGGNGGSGSNPVTQGSAPGNAAGTSGAGGGGSGSVAYQSGGFILPRNGGNGGSGRMYIITVEES